MTDDKNRSEVGAVIDDVKRELRSLFVKSDEQLKKVGNAFKKSGFKEESICEEIKNALKEEIAEGVISTIKRVQSNNLNRDPICHLRY